MLCRSVLSSFIPLILDSLFRFLSNLTFSSLALDARAIQGVARLSSQRDSSLPVLSLPYSQEINSLLPPSPSLCIFTFRQVNSLRRNLTHIHVINTILMRPVLVIKCFSAHIRCIQGTHEQHTYLPSTVAAVVHVRKLLHNFNLNGIFFSCGYFLFAHPQVRHPFSLTLLPLFFLFTFFPSTPSEPERKSSRMF